MIAIEAIEDVSVLRIEHGKVNALDVELLEDLTTTRRAPHIGRAPWPPWRSWKKRHGDLVGTDGGVSVSGTGWGSATKQLETVPENWSTLTLDFDAHGHAVSGTGSSLDVVMRNTGKSAATRSNPSRSAWRSTGMWGRPPGATATY
jgi:hypothetical protein